MFIVKNSITPEQAEQVQPYFPGDLQYIFIILHHSQYWFQLFIKKCDVDNILTCDKWCVGPTWYA